MLVQVNWHNYKGEQVAEHKVRVKTSACVRDVLQRLQDIEPEAKKAKALRLMEVLHSKIYKVPAALIYALLAAGKTYSIVANQKGGFTASCTTPVVGLLICHRGNLRRMSPNARLSSSLADMAQVQVLPLSARVLA